MRRLARILGRLSLALGWLGFFVCLILIVAEKSELLTHFVRKLLVERLGAAGREFDIEHASLEWFSPRIHLSGVRVGVDGDMIRFDEATVWGPR